MNIDWLLNRIDSSVLPDRRVRVLGIDLGTTNSVICEAIWDPNSPQEAKINCLEVEQKTRYAPIFSVLVPSAVALHQNQSFIGEGAKRLIAESPRLGLKPRIDYFSECKNEIGTDRNYSKAPDGYRSPAEIGSHVISFLLEAAGKPKPDAVVVTVPASFQVAQRKDTISAAWLAGIELADGDLCDEPVAAYIDYMATGLSTGTETRFESGRILVFDYGGGTCDIALFELADPSVDGLIAFSPKSISRYHRLGGSDIDAAILYGPLLNQIIEQNHLDPGTLGYHDKKNFIDPALRSVAESLKIGLCKEIDRRRTLEADNATFSEPPKRKLPNTYPIRLSSGEDLRLSNPTLHEGEFESILVPFLDHDIQFPRTNEYRTELSIFAPIDDALSRGGISRREVDFVLLAGGSSNIPACRDRITDYFSSSRILHFKDTNARKFSVARGAALQALSKTLTGTVGLVRPVCSDDIFIKMQGDGETQSTHLKLMERGQVLPFPSTGGKKTLDCLAVPRSSEKDPVTLLVEVVAGNEHRLLFKRPWEITAPVSMGEPLTLEFSYDANQVLELDLFKREMPRAQRFSKKTENPLIHIVDPKDKEIQIERLQREIESGGSSGKKRYDKVLELTNLLVEIKRNEQALELFKVLQRSRFYDQAWLLNRMAIIYENIYDDDRAEQLYLQSAKTNINYASSLYNLSLLFRKKGNHNEAIKALEQAIAREKKGSYLIFRAELAKEIGDDLGHKEFLEEAFKTFPSLDVFSEFELNAYIRGANALGDNKHISKFKKELKRRDIANTLDVEGYYPIATENDNR